VGIDAAFAPKRFIDQTSGQHLDSLTSYYTQQRVQLDYTDTGGAISIRIVRPLACAFWAAPGRSRVVRAARGVSQFSARCIDGLQVLELERALGARLAKAADFLRSIDGERNN